MTKLRPPLTYENALFRVLGRIGAERAAAVTGKTHGYLLSLSDPDKRERLAIEDAEALDLEYQACGGKGAPIYETLGLRLDAARAERFGDAAALQRQVAIVAYETGEAIAAQVLAALPGASELDRREAIRETEEAIGAHTHALALLQSSTREKDPNPGSQAAPLTNSPAAIAGGQPP